MADTSIQLSITIDAGKLPVNMTKSRKKFWKKAMEQSVGTMQAGIARNAPKDFGQLANSFQTEVKGEGFSDMRGDVTSPHLYALVMEHGRKAGARMPPPGNLEIWAQRHGMPPGSGFWVARAIQVKGIKGRKYIEKTVNSERVKVEGFFRVALNIAVNKI